MPAQRLVSRAQMEILLSFMNQHRDFANCKMSAKKEAALMWEELATLLTNDPNGGAKRSGEMWRRYWAERKYNVRKKAKDIQQALSTGKPCRMKLSDEEMKIYDVIGRMSDKVEPSNMIPFPPFQEEEESLQSGPSDPLSNFDKFLTEDTSLKEPATTKKYKEPEQTEPKTELLNQLSANEDTEPDPTNPDGPPQWAIDIEERRVAATERIAASLELLASAVVGMNDSIRTLTHDVAGIKEVLVSRPP